jgi:predicted O-methyltransferase YrrM
MPLPPALRRLAPAPLRDSPRLRGIALGAGLIPPRPMHTEGEAELLRRLAATAARVVEIGVYEGSSAVALCAVLTPDAELHLVDPFGHHPTALPQGWGATERASRRVVARAARREGPRVVWHVELSEQTARGWSAPVDLVFVDGDHAEAATRLDWELWHGHVTPGGHLLFHDAREGKPEGRGLPGPTRVVDELFRGAQPAAGWAIAAEVDRTVAVRKDVSAARPA